MAKLNCMNVARMVRSCLGKKKSVGYVSQPIGMEDFSVFNCCGDDGQVVVVSVKTLECDDELDNVRMLNLVRRIRHLKPSVEQEGWLTFTRLTEELCDLVEHKIPQVRS